jgi:uncharacterized protein (UPF0305 family)
MVSWYIKCRGLKSPQYLKKVEETVEPFMEYFIGRISDIEEYDIEKIEELYKEIFDELPVMRLRTNKNYNYSSHSKEIEIWLEYNKETDIIFVDPKKSIRREILLNNLFKDDEKI